MAATNGQMPLSMKAGGWLWALCLVFFLVQGDVCLGRLELTQIPPITIFLLFSVPLVIYAWLSRGAFVYAAMVGCRMPLLAFAAIATLAVMGGQQNFGNESETSKFILLPLLASFVFIVGIHAASLCENEDRWRFVFSMGLCANACSILTDAFIPGTFSFLGSRAAGFGINPNTGALLSVLLLILSLDWRQFRGFVSSSGLVATGCLGVFLTLSRSGMLMLLATLAYYYWEPLRKQTLKCALFFVGIVAMGGLLLSDARNYLLDSVPMFASLGSRASLFFGTGQMEDTMNDARVLLVRDFLSLISERPLFGWGTGFHVSNGRDGPHNMFLTRWVDNGVGGFIAYISLLFSLWLVNHRRGNRLGVATVLLVLINSFFSHNLLEDRAVMLALGFAVGVGVLKPQRLTLTLP